MDRAVAIPEIVRRLVEYYQPERIYLFGSYALGVAGDTPKELLGPQIHQALWRRGIYTAADTRKR